MPAVFLPDLVLKEGWPVPGGTRQLTHEPTKEP